MSGQCLCPNVRYKNDPQIVAMTSLVTAYQERDVKAAEKILKGELYLTVLLTCQANKSTITADPFISFFIDDLLRTLRTQYIVDMIKPYTRLKLDFLADVSALYGLPLTPDVGHFNQPS